MQSNIKTKFCFCSGCKYPYTHLTSKHVCGSCKGRGHGQMECKNTSAKELLRKQSVIPIPKHAQCNIDGCESKYSHTKEGHLCCFCDQYHKSNCVFTITIARTVGNPQLDCAKVKKFVIKALKRTDKKNRIYIEIPSRDGYWIAKCDVDSREIVMLHVTSKDSGTIFQHVLVNFINGHICVNDPAFIL